MALTYLRVTVSNPSAPQKKELVRFMVDSGAVYSVVSRKTLAQLPKFRPN